MIATMACTMNRTERLLARSRAYQLFSHLFLQGQTAESQPLLAAIPELAAHIRQGANQAAAAHYWLFGLNVFPYEAIFLDADNLLGGHVAESVARFYHETGYVAPDAESPDHIGCELGLLAFLCGAEFDAAEDQKPQYMQRMRHLQRRFLDAHVLRWLPALVQAIRQQGAPFYSALAELTLALVLEHRRALGDDLLNPSAAFHLPQPPDILDSEKTGLKEIAAYLLTPAYSGFYLSHDDIRRIGVRHQLPQGFGKRQQTLANLLRSAADHDSLAEVIESLQAIIWRWQTFYAGTALAQHFITAWLQRLAQASDLLQHMQAAVQELSD